MKEQRLTEQDIIRQHLVNNGNGTISVGGYVTLTVRQDAINLAIMTLRGFPNGMSLEEYPNEFLCNKASPGISDAGHKSRHILNIPCTVTVDRDGNRVVTLAENEFTKTIARHAIDYAAPRGASKFMAFLDDAQDILPNALPNKKKTKAKNKRA